MRRDVFHGGGGDDDDAQDDIDVCTSTFDEERGMKMNHRYRGSSSTTINHRCRPLQPPSPSQQLEEEDDLYYTKNNEDPYYSVVEEEDNNHDVVDGGVVDVDDEYRYDDNNNGNNNNNYEPPIIDHDSLHWRTILPRDRLRIQSLHEEWFPVVYQEEFYDQLVHQRMPNTGEPLFTCVATEVDEPLHHHHHQYPVRGTSGGNSSSSGFGTGAGHGGDNNYDNNDNCDYYHSEKDHDYHHEQENENEPPFHDTVVACVVGAVIDARKLNVASRQLLISNMERYHRLFYIMTLGTATEYRQAGLATALVEKCQDQVASDPHCGVLYLHVITINHSAIRFYERLGFWKVQEIPDYYTIDGKNYNCFLYAKYFNGNRGHLDIFKIMSRWVSSIWDRFKDPLSILVGDRPSY